LSIINPIKWISVPYFTIACIPVHIFITISFYVYPYSLSPIHTLYPLNAYAITNNPVIIHIATPHNTLCPPSTPSTLTPFPPLTAEAATFPPPAVPPPELTASVELAGNVVVPVTVNPPPPPPFVVGYILVCPIVVSFDPLLHLDV